MKKLFLLCLLVETALGAAVESKKVGEQRLVLNGRGVQRKFTLKIYELSLFVVHKSHNAEQIVASLEPKFATMKFLRGVSSKQIKDSFTDSYNENCGHDCDRLRPHFKALLASIPDMKKNSSFEFTFAADALTIRSTGKKPSTIPSGEFARVLLRSWVGPHSPSENIRKALLGI